MTDWSARCEVLDAHPGRIKVHLSADDQPLRFSDLLRLLTTSERFADWYSDLLRNIGFSAFFWEHPSLTLANVDDKVEFVMLDAPALTNATPDSVSFAAQFARADEDIALFKSLGGDAQLLAPCPLAAESDYSHLGAFLRTAPTAQIRALWRQTGRAASESVGTAPLWLSTSGLGVSWLHIRLDTRPKYYQHQPYKRTRLMSR